MKRVFIYLSVVAFIFSACEDEVDINLKNGEPFLAVDAFLTNQPGPQQIVLTYTQPYFEQGLPPTISNATVSVVEQETGRVYSFTYNEEENVYEWTPADDEDIFGVVGSNYALQISHNGIDYVAASRMNEVPTLDSITFEFTSEPFIEDDYYVGEFWSKDLEGTGDTYWIKTWKNEIYLNKPSELLFSYDAGGGVGADVDGVMFIPPIRFGINPWDEDQDGNIIPTYLEGDSVYVELHSISNEAYFFLSRLANETNRPGGFGELFSDPLGSIPTNIVPSNKDVRVAGFFNTAAVSSLGVQVDEQTIRDKLPD